LTLSQKSAAQNFSVKQSQILLKWLIFIHALAAFACVANALPWIYQLTTLMMVGGSVFFNLRCYYTQFQPYQLKCSEDFVWSIAERNNDFQTIHILPSSVITTLLIALQYQLESGKKQSLVILKDALSETDYRKLVVTLKIAGLSDNAA
jgi:hypothetical protein